MSCAYIFVCKIGNSVIYPVGNHERCYELIRLHQLHTFKAENAEICSSFRKRQGFLKKAALKNIVAVHECDPSALRHIKSHVSRRRYSAVFF